MGDLLVVSGSRSRALHAAWRQWKGSGIVPFIPAFYTLITAIHGMLTLAAFLIGTWFLGLMLSFTMNGMIHLLLVAGIAIASARIASEAVA